MEITAYCGDCGELLAVWDASVRTTHDFLTEADVAAIRPLVAEAFGAVQLFVIRDDEGMAAFMGVCGRKVEMLFIRPGMQGFGLGRRLMEYAIKEFEIKQVDVNEQNPRALGFYEKMGFRIVSRDALDGAGMPFPILHLELK